MTSFYLKIQIYVRLIFMIVNMSKHFKKYIYFKSSKLYKKKTQNMCIMGLTMARSSSNRSEDRETQIHDLKVLLLLLA